MNTPPLTLGVKLISNPPPSWWAWVMRGPDLAAGASGRTRELALESLAGLVASKRWADAPAVQKMISDAVKQTTFPA